MDAKLSASLMCADLSNLAADIKRLKALGVEYLHMDYMDGQFVPNITFGIDTICAVRNAAEGIPLDIHLMAYDPEKLFDRLEIKEGEYVSVHLEAVRDMNSVLYNLKNRGARPGIAICPDTPIEGLIPYLSEIDLILVMMIHPGFSGRPILPGMIDRIAQVKSLLLSMGKSDIPIMVDGNVSFELAGEMRRRGAEIFVNGTTSIFTKGEPLEVTVPRFREILRKSLT